MIVGSNIIQINFGKDEERAAEYIAWGIKNLLKHEMVETECSHIFYIQAPFCNEFFKHFDICSKDGLMKYD